VILFYVVERILFSIGLVKGHLYFQFHWLEKKTSSLHTTVRVLNLFFLVIMSELIVQCVITIYYIKRKISTFLVHFVALKGKLCHGC